MSGRVRVQLCSGLAVESGGRLRSGADLGSRKARTLLALLASARGRQLELDAITEALWPDGAPRDPAANVATLVSRLRRLLGEEVVQTHGRTYGLTPTCSVDVDEAASLLEQARERETAGEPALAAAAADRALGLLGPALVGEADAEWARTFRREVDELRRTARHRLAATLRLVDPARAVLVASEALAADPLDERALRELIRALAVDGRPAAALAAYDEMAGRLREELGADPDPATAALHLALLREEPLTADDGEPGHATPRRPASVGREDELAVLDRAWSAASGGSCGLVVVDGEPGIGKTHVLRAAAELAGSTGGLVLSSRCRPAERSLFLQPYVDALRPVLLKESAAGLRELLEGHTAEWVNLVPDLAELVVAAPLAGASPAMERRRSHDAVAVVLRRLSRQRPVLLTIDDLQEGSTATVDLLGYLGRRLGPARVLLLAAIRSDDIARVVDLADVATPVPLGPLPPSAVQALAEAAGLSARAQEVLQRTAGHPLSVVECLRALGEGESGVPRTLAEAIGLRVQRLEPQTRRVLELACVAGGRMDALRLAHMGDLTELATVHECEELVRLRLMNRAGAEYEVVNDLVQESVHDALPPALAAALHRRAADAFSDRPEAMAAHAYAAGEPDRAAHGWWLAGREAMGRSAIDDATDLFDRSLQAGGDTSLRTRVLLARARAHEAATRYPEAIGDVDAALSLAHEVGDRRLEMAALRVSAGDIPVALGRPNAELTARLEEGLRVASGLGDRHSEGHFAGRLSALAASDLRLGRALDTARRNLIRGRASASEDALVLGLDAVKTVCFYLGDGALMAEVVDELEPLLRRRRSTWLLQWTAFESAVIPAAQGDWDAALARVDSAVALNKATGGRLYGGFFLAHAGLFHRLAGDLDAAIDTGEQALRRAGAAAHPWWYAATAGLHAATLVEADRLDEAAAVARRGLAATAPGTARAWRLSCLAPLAVATADTAARAEATTLIESVEAPADEAWVLGVDAYLLVARAWADEDPERSARVLAPLLAATTSSWPAIRERAAAAQSSSATSPAARRAPSSGTAR